MVKTNHETASAIDCIRKIQELTDSKLIKCEKWNESNRFPTFTFSITGDDDCDYTMDIYYGGNAGWEVADHCIGLNYKMLTIGIVPFLHLLNCCQATIKYEDIRKEFDIEEKDE